MNRHPVPATDRYTLIDETNAAHGRVAFISFGPETRFGRGYSVFSCTPNNVSANVAAIKRDGGRVFNKRTGAEL